MGESNRGYFILYFILYQLMYMCKNSIFCAFVEPKQNISLFDKVVPFDAILFCFYAVRLKRHNFYSAVTGTEENLFAMMDDETHFLIAQEIAETKEKHDARVLFFRAKRLMGKQPKTLITDGLPSYFVACEQVFAQIVLS